MQKEDDCRRQHTDRGMSDLNSVESIVFIIFPKKLKDLHGIKNELLDCHNKETDSVNSHELFIGQDVVDLEQLIADTPHREATDDSDGPNSGKKEHIF